MVNQLWHLHFARGDEDAQHVNSISKALAWMSYCSFYVYVGRQRGFVEVKVNCAAIVDVVSVFTQYVVKSGVIDAFILFTVAN